MLKEKLAESLQLAHKLSGIHSQLEKEQKELTFQVEDLKKKIAIREKTTGFLKTLLDTLVAENVSIFSSLVTEGLRLVVHDQNVAFKAEVQQKSDLIIRFTTVEGDIEGDVLDSFGGMVACLESFILRILCILKLKLRRILILDEVFAQVSAEYLENTSQLIKKLCTDFQIDFLLVTHQPKLLKYADNVYLAESVIRNGEKELILTKEEK